MAKLSKEERRALLESVGRDYREPPLMQGERLVAPTVAARQNYIRFATQAARFYRGDKPVSFVGNHWKL